MDREGGVVERVTIWICLLLNVNSPGSCSAQDSSLSSANRKTANHKPEILTSGFIDVVTNGQVNASARLIRIYLGEPGKFSLPLSIYSGVSSGNLGGPQINGARNNEQLAAAFINPLSGLVNASFEGELFSTGEVEDLTSAGFLYQLGIRVLTGYKAGSPADPLTGKPVNFFNTYGAGGFYFQTGAWEKNDAGNIGTFWLTARYMGTYTSSRILNDVIPDINSGFYHGWSFGGGVKINNVVNIKIVFYNYVKGPELGYVMPLCQFSFHYALMN